MTNLTAKLHQLKAHQNWHWWLVALALLLRLFHLETWSFWEDEALTILLARQPVPHLIATLVTADVHPPLYFLLVKVFMLLDQSEFIIRLPSALCSVGAVLILFFIGRDLFDKQAGMVAALLMTFSPLQLLYAQEARMYAQLLLLTVLSSWAFIRAWPGHDKRWWGLFVAGTTLACYTSYFIFPVFLAMGLYVLLIERKWARLWPFGLSMLIAAGLYLPWLAIFLFQTRSVLADFWLTSPHPLILLTTLSGFFVGVSLPAFWIAVALAATLLIIFVVLNNVRHSLINGNADNRALIWLLLWLFVPLLGLYLISLIRPIFQLRAVITSSPPLYLLIGWGLVRVSQKRLNQWLFLPTAGVMLFSLFNFYFNPAFAKPAWREAAVYVRDHAQPNDVAVHTSDGSFLPFLTYEPNIEQVRLQDDPTTAAANSRPQAIITAITSAPQSITAALSGHQRAWLVLGLDRSVADQLAQKDYFDRHYTLLHELEIRGIYIFEYGLLDQ